MLNETIKTINELHSVRKFIDKEITKEILNTILESSIRAGNSGNRQVYSILTDCFESVIIILQKRNSKEKRI